MKTLITTSRIPASVPPKARARLMRLQFEKVRKAMRSKWFLWCPATMKNVVPYTMKMEPCAIDKEFSEALKRTELKWVITCYILSKQRNGKLELTEEALQINTPCTHNDISRLAADFHWQMIEEFRASMKGPDFITAAWVANTEKSPSIEDAWELLGKVGAWDIPSDREEVA